MALQRDPPYVGSIGDSRDPMCDDPTHSDDCDCGARPDHQYEKQAER